MTLFDKRTHEAEEEGKHESAYMRAVNIGISHDDYFAVAELWEVDLISYTTAESGYYRHKFIIAVNTVKTGFFNIEHFSPQW